MQDFYVYILKCADDSYYIGHTDNILQRLSQHASGKGDGYTSKRLPFEVMLILPCPSRVEALACEHKLKRWTRVKKEAFIRQNWNEISRLAKKEFGKNG